LEEKLTAKESYQRKFYRKKENKKQTLQIEHQKFHILIDLKIQGMPFRLKTLIDTGSDLNMLHKDIIPVSYGKRPKLWLLA
jgi:hypothetical protein